MEKTAIWYITDSDAGRKIAANIRELGLSIQTLTVDELATTDISFSMIHIIILDIGASACGHHCTGAQRRTHQLVS